MTLYDMKIYLRVDGEHEDKMILDFMETADEYIKSVVSESVIENNPRKVDMVKRLLVADWYENRIAKERPVTSAVSLLISQLQAEGRLKNE